MADDKTSKEGKKKKGSGGSGGSSSNDKNDASDRKKKDSRKKVSASKRTSRSPSAKKAGTPIPESPRKNAAETTVRRAEKKGTQRKGSSSNAKEKAEEKKKGEEKKANGMDWSKKMTQAEYDKWCDAECEMWSACGPFKVPPKRKFVVSAGRLFKASEEVPALPSLPILSELLERTRRYNNKTSVKVKSKKKLRKMKSSVEDKFTTKKD